MEHNLNIATEAVLANNAFIQSLGKSRVFIDKSIYAKYCEFQRPCDIQQTYFWEKEIYKRQYFDNEHKECYNRTTQIMSMNDEICLNLKEYLDKLKIISSDQ